MANRAISVSALNAYTKEILDRNDILSNLAVCGEIANFVHHKSGHLYFSLRDENASIKAVMFRSRVQELSFYPKEGMKVILWGYVSLYEKTGTYQFYADGMSPHGVGAVQMAFEQLKEKLGQEGLFAQERKRCLPAFPHKVGLITSRDGAALQDILSITSRRWPLLEYRLYPVNVQGVDAAKQVCHAVHVLNQDPDIEVIIIARGGGSAEDLWVFNDEKLARTVAASRVPTVSAIGHEVDFTILDFVADLRAPTPSAAAEILCPNKEDYLQQTEAFMQNIHQNIQLCVYRCYNDTVAVCKTIFAESTGRLQNGALKGHSIWGQIEQRMSTLVKEKQSDILHICNTIDSASPDKIFKRGFAAVTDLNEMPLMLEQVREGQHFLISNRNMKVHCLAEQVENEEHA